VGALCADDALVHGSRGAGDAVHLWGLRCVCQQLGGGPGLRAAVRLGRLSAARRVFGYQYAGHLLL
jgi:hypothetical protein